MKTRDYRDHLGDAKDAAFDIRPGNFFEKKKSQDRWDQYFLDIAEVVRQKSKDPSSKIGAVLVDQNKSIFSTGFNGFPIGVSDDPKRYNDRPTKYKYVCHAERNAIALAAKKGSATGGSTLYLVGFGPPTAPCIECSKMIIQSGIIRVVGRPFTSARADWMEDLQFSVALLEEAGVKFDDFGESCKRIGGCLHDIGFEDCCCDTGTCD